MRALGVLSLFLVLMLPIVDCNRSIFINACGLVTKAEIEKAAGVSVTHTVVEDPHAVSMAAGKVMETTASCSYMLETAAGKPARIKINVDAFNDHTAALIDFSSWGGAKRATGLGDDAWQDPTALEILKKNIVLVVETDPTQESPKAPIPPSEENQEYPKIQAALADIALRRL